MFLPIVVPDQRSLLGEPQCKPHLDPTQFGDLDIGRLKESHCIFLCHIASTSWGQGSAQSASTLQLFDTLSQGIELLFGLSGSLGDQNS